MKITCNCRKPATGMIDQAVKDYNIDLSKSYFIGDTTTDLMTARNAGVTPVLVSTGYGGEDKKFAVTPDFKADNLENAVDLILTLTTI